jgi:hypothetical protein
MEPAKDHFYPLQILLFDLHISFNHHKPIAPVTCVFDKCGTRNCASETSEGNRDLARSHFKSILTIPNVHDVRENTSKLLKTFHELANLLLCDEHAIHCRLLRSQWIWEFERRRAETLSDLKQYYEPMNHGDLDEEENEEEEVDAIPAHSFPTAGFKKLWPDMKEEDVALRVTEKLNQPLGPHSKLTGCVYIISPRATEFKGMLKVGYTCKHPKLYRFSYHKRCMGPFDVIKVRSVTCAQRVEQLLFAEFSHVRYGMRCQNCPTTHKEWFKIDKEIILESLDKWCSFFDETAPYRPDGQLGALPEDGSILLSPVLKQALRQARSARSSPFNTPSKKADKKQSPRRETATRNARTGTPPETPTKRSQHKSSFLVSPSNSGLKVPTITTTPLPDSDGEYSATQESTMDPEEPTVGLLAAAFRRLGFTQ